jgi:hypothetical protein
MANTTKTTSPNAMPAATTSSPSRAMCAGWCLVTMRMTTLAAIRMAPIMTVTAAATDRAMTSRTLLVVAVPERTAQRSHRGYRPASQMASCNHYDRHSGRPPADPIERIVPVRPPTPLARHFSFLNGTGFKRLE